MTTNVQPATVPCPYREANQRSKKVEPRRPLGAAKAPADAEDLSIDEVMYELRIGRTRAYQLCEEGKLTYRQEGRRKMVPRSAIDEYREATMVRRRSS